MGIPATGKKFQIEGNMICSMKGSKCEEIWFYLDSLGFMKQLGAIPSQAVKK
jgi:predicted ester cyclase